MVGPQFLKLPLPYDKAEIQTFGTLQMAVPTSDMSLSAYLIDGTLGFTAHSGHLPEGFAQIRSEKEAAVERKRGDGNSVELGQALLEFAVITLQQGDVQLADNALTEALALPRLSNETRFQLLTYHCHCQFMQFQYSPARMTFITEELKSFMDATVKLQQWENQINAAKANVNPSNSRLLSSVLAFQRRIWSAKGILAGSGVLDVPLGIFSRSEEQEIAHFITTGIDKSTLASLRIDLADLYRVDGQPDKAELTMTEVLSEADDSSNLAYLGSCYLLKGDWKVSSYTVPTTWNMFPLQGKDSNTQQREREWQEFKLDGLDIVGAHSDYNTSHHYFEAIDHVQGLAAVELRLAYLSVLEASKLGNGSHRYAVALKHAENAKEKYHSAADHAGYHLALAHVALCQIGAGNLVHDERQARAIGHWGRTWGSRSFAAGIGLFIARYARRWQVVEGDYERSIAALAFAEALFSELGLPLSHAHSITDLASAFEALGDRTGFLINAQRSLDICMQPLSANFSSLVPWMSSHAGFVVDRMMARATKYANPADIRNAASHARRLREGTFASRYRSNCGLIPIMIGLLLAGFGVDQGLAAMGGIGQNLLIGLAEPGMFLLIGFTLCFSSAMRELKAWSGKISYAIMKWMMMRFNRAALFANLTIALLTLSNPAENMASFQRIFQLDHALHQADVLEPIYESRVVRRDGKRSKAQAEADVEALLQRAEAAIRPRGGLDQVFMIALHAERVEFQQAAAVCQSWWVQHQRFLGAVLNEPQGQDWRSLEQNQRRNHLLNAAQAFQRCRSYHQANQLLDELKESYGDEWWEQGREPWGNLVLAGQILEGLGQFEGATYVYNKAAEVFEDRRMQLNGDEYKVALSSNASAHETYFAASRAFVKWHQSIQARGNLSTSSYTLEQAFKAAERGKARSLLDLVTGGVSFDQANLPGDISFETYRTISVKLATARALLAQAYSQETADPGTVTKLQQNVDELEKEFRGFEAQLSTTRHGPGSLHINSEIVGLDVLANHLSKDTLLLQFAYWSSDLVAWAVTQDGIVAVQLLQEREAVVEHYAHRFRYLIETGRHDEENVAKWLSKTFLEPFSPLIHDHQHLVIVPYGRLHLVPFHALPFAGAYLSSYHTVSYEPSASVYCHLRSFNATNCSILAIGNPINMYRVDKYTGERQTLDPLEYAQQEAEYIGTLGVDSVALTKERATKDQVLRNLPNFDIIHLATHGEPDPEVPMLSAIYLAHGEALTVADLVNQKLKAKLVVLSACRSGEGEVAGGDEIMGFTRALLAAGVQSVVVSLWPVDDQRTTLLMEGFYKALLAGAPPAVALQIAQNGIRSLTQDEVHSQLQLAFNSILQHATRNETREFATRLVKGEEAEIVPGKDSNQGISNPQIWAPFIVIGR